MINKYTLNAISNAMRVVKLHNVTLNVEDTSPVGLLNLAVDPQGIYNHSITDEEFYGRLEAITAAKQPEKGTGEQTVFVDSELSPVALSIDDHEVTLHDLKQMAINRCWGMLDFSRNVMQPFVQDVMKNMVISDHHGVVEDWTIVPVPLDSCLKEPIVDAIINAVKNPTGNGFTHETFAVSVPDTLAMPETGSRNYDTLLRKLVEESGLSFVGVVKDMLGESIISPAAGDAYKEVKRKVLHLLLAAHYIENPWQDSGLSSFSWESTFNKLFYTLVGWVYSYISEYAVNVEVGRIVIASSAMDKTVTVCQEAFDNFISSGGCPECLFGAIYESEEGATSSLLASGLLKDQVRYVEAWKRRSEITAISETTNWLVKNRDAMKKAVCVAIDNLEPGYYKNVHASADKAKEQCCNHINVALNSDTDDLTRVAIACAGVLFKEYQCEMLTRSVHAAMLENRDPGEAAREWIIEYVLDWILGGFYVDNSKS